MKIYIATSLSRAKDHNAVRDELVKKGHEITYDWTVHGNVKHDVLRLHEISQKERDGIKDSDCVVALLPGGRGTHCEIGIAIGLGRPLFLVGGEKFFEAGLDTCAFYWLPGVVRLTTWPDMPIEKMAHAIAEII